MRLPNLHPFFALVALFVGCGPTSSPILDPSLGSSKDALDPEKMLYWGGDVLTHPKIYLIFWGPEWVTGFHDGMITSIEVMDYTFNFFRFIGGSDWLNTQTQYCSGAPLFSDTCPASASFVGNPASMFGGVWVDGDTAPPPEVAKDQISAEAFSGRVQFGALDDSIFVVFTSPNSFNGEISGHGGTACGWHSWDTTPEGAEPSGRYPYIYMPWQPGLPGCGTRSVNSDDLFGHGILDGYSITGGHELGEVLTDPFGDSGWHDTAGGRGETGDKCSWKNLENVSFGTHYGWWAMQPLWSNRFNKCDQGVTAFIDVNWSTIPFGDVEVGTVSERHTVTLKNTGQADLILTSGFLETDSFTGFYPVDDQCAGKVLHPIDAGGDPCHVSFEFSPSSPGPHRAHFTILNGSRLTPPTILLTGTGTRTFYVFDPGEVRIPGLPVGRSSPTHPVHFVNESGSNTYVESVRLASPAQTFRLAFDQCSGTNLPPEGRCSVGVTFTPHSVGADAANVLFSLRNQQIPRGVRVFGRGEGPELEVASELNFDDVQIGASRTLHTTVRSHGRLPVNISSITAHAPFFTQSHCPRPLDPGQHCEIDVTFAPTVGPFNMGTLTIASNAGEQRVKLTGVGTAPQARVNPGTLIFSRNQLSKTVTVTNVGDAPLRLYQVYATSGYAVQNSCPNSLAAGANCSIALTATLNSSSGSLFLVDNGLNSPQRVPLLFQQ